MFFETLKDLPKEHACSRCEKTRKEPLSAAHCRADEPVSLFRCVLAPDAMSLLRACMLAMRLLPDSKPELAT